MKITLSKSQPKSLIGKRECVHVPVVIATSKVALSIGEKVVFVNSEEVTNIDHSSKAEPDGIVDPFFKEISKYAGIFIPPNTPVAILLYPGKVENIHHEFNIKGLDNKEE